MPFCQSRTVVKPKEREERLTPLYCRCWTCDDCAERRKRQLIAEILSGNPFIFLTLTTRYQPEEDPNEEAKRQSHAWRLLVHRIRRRWPGHEFEFVTLREPTKRGWPHLHILGRMPYIEFEWLQQQWKELTDAWNVRIEYIRKRRQQARYVAKYVTKASVWFGTAKRYWFSQSYRDVDSQDLPAFDTPSGDYYLANVPPLAWAALRARQGWTIIEEHNAWLCRAPP